MVITGIYPDLNPDERTWGRGVAPLKVHGIRFTVRLKPGYLGERVPNVLRLDSLGFKPTTKRIVVHHRFSRKCSGSVARVICSSMVLW